MTIRVMNPTTANPVSAPAGPAVLRAFPLFAYILVPIRPPMAINCVKYQCGSAVGVCRLTKFAIAVVAAFISTVSTMIQRNSM